MENKKPIIIAAIIVIIIAAGWALTAKFRELKSSDKITPSVSGEPKNPDLTAEKETSLIPPAARNTSFMTGTVEKIENNTLYLTVGTQVLTLQITPDYAIFLEEGDDLIATDLAKLKEGSKVKVRHKTPAAPPDKKFIPSGANQGVVTAINDTSMTLQMEAGMKVVDITSKPNIYMMEGETSVPKTAYDLKVGSIVTIAYADEATKSVVVVVRIDQL
ncbi:MAG TPA: hypothetical protein VF390_02220 [Patescibacteria group bacterium]